MLRPAWRHPAGPTGMPGSARRGRVRGAGAWSRSSAYIRPRPESNGGTSGA